MCFILGMYTWQLKNGEVVVTQTTRVSARAYMLRLFHSINKYDNSHYRYDNKHTITIEYGLFVCDFLEMNVYI